MGRGGRLIYKRAAPNRWHRRRSDGEDDDDEEYVLEEEDEEDEESCEEPLASDGEEEEYEFNSGSSNDDEPVEQFDEDDEDEDELLATRSKRRKAPSKSKKQVKKSRVSYDDDDDDVDYEEENDEDEDLLASRSKRLTNPPKPNRKVKKSRVSYDDGDDDYRCEEEEEDLVASKTGGRRNSSGVRSRQHKFRASNYEATEEEEDEDEDFSPDEDVDFSPDVQDLDDDDDEAFVTSGLRKGGAVKEGGNKPKSKVLTQNKRKRSSRKRPKVEHEDDFIVKDRIAVARKTKKTKKIRTKNKSLKSRAVKNKSPVESDESDFDFVTSDDDFVEDTIMLGRRRSKLKNARRTKKARKGRTDGLSDELESSSDDDYIISEEELRDLGVAGLLDQPQQNKIVTGSKGDDKGKEKENEELGKPLCGICLSEEQWTTVRGVLNCCTHFFCFACILEWSKVESRCPVCKRRFETITKSSRSDPGFRLRKTVIKVEERDQVYQPSEEEIRRMLDPYENVVCIECHQGGDDRLMLLCDICDSPAHTYCVGLGREVPEGNWYCNSCRSDGHDLSYMQDQIFATDPAAASSDFFGSNVDTEAVAAHHNTNPQRSSQPSIQDFDLNVSPRPVEDYGSMSQHFGAGPRTVSGRRAMRQRIRIMLSNSRPRQIFEENHLSRSNTPSDVMTSELRQNRESLHTHVSHSNTPSEVMTSEIRRSRERMNAPYGLSSFNRVVASEQFHQSSRPFQSDNNVVQCTTSSSLQHLDSAKRQVQSIIKCHLKELSSDTPLDRSTLKLIKKRSTHTILAALGIIHDSSMVFAPVPTPSSCSHNLVGEQVSIIRGCCSSCFNSYIKYVVQKILYST